MTPLLRAGLLGLASLQSGPAAVDAVDGVYTLTDGGRFEMLGVCRIDTDGIDCWKRDGSRDETLIKTVLDYYERSRQQDIAFRPGFKHRFAILRRPMDNYGYFTLAEGKVGRSFEHSTSTDRFTWGRYTVDPSAQTFDAYFTITRAKPLAPFDLPLTKGAKTELGGIRFEVDEIAPIKGGLSINPFQYGFPTLGKNPKGWKVLNVKGGSLDPRVDITMQVIGKDGQEVKYVGPNGEPLSEVAYLQAMAENSLAHPGGSFSGYSVALLQSGPGGFFDYETGVAYKTNVDPAHIKAIRIQAYERIRVRFSGLPADPR